MYKPPIKGRIIKKKEEVQEVPNLMGSVTSVVKLVTELNKVKKSVDDKFIEMDEAVSELRDTVEEVKSIKKGEPGETPDLDELASEVTRRIRMPQDGKSADEDAIVSRLKRYIPNIDEDAIEKRILSKIPKPKSNLKIIRDKVEIDPMSVIDKILALPEEKRSKLLKAENISGLNQTISAFHNQVGSRGYLHGGGISNITGLITAGTNVTITGSGTKTDPYVINSSGGGGGGTVSQIDTTGPITGGPITTTGTIGITQATTSTDGYLSSTDWNTFNGKQSALTFSQSLVNTAGTVTLVSDTASPGNNKFYGTNGSGTRAWNPSLIGSTNFTSTETWLGVGAGASSASTAATTLVGSDAGSNTSGSNLMTAIGSGAGQNAGSSIGLTAIGYRAGYNGVGGIIPSSIFIGNGAGNGAPSASNSIFIGDGAGASDPVNNNSGGGASILIGNTTSTGNNKNSIALGTGATNTNPNQFLVASAYTRFSMRGLDYIMPSAFGSAGTALVDIGGNGTLQWTTPNTLLDKILAAGATNSIDNGAFAQTWQWNSLAGQTAMTLSSNSTAAASSTQKLLGLSLSGTNATSNQTTTVASFSNTHIGTGSTNIGATFVASGGSVNIAATFVGNVGIGRLSAPEMLSIGQSGLGAQIGLYGNTSGVVTVKPAAAAGTWTLTVPTTAGNSGEVLTTDGSGVTSWVAPSTVGASGPDGSVQIAVSGTFSSSTAIIFDTVAETLRLENTSSNPQLFFKGGSASGGYLDAISSVSGLWNDFNDQPIAVFNESNNTHFLANNQFSHDGTNGLTYWGSTANGIYGVIDVPNTKLSLISTTGIVFDYSATTGTVFTFPTSDGSAGDVLTTDGTGGLSFLPAGSSSTITVGATPVASGVDTYVLFDDAGTVGEYAISGTGSVAMTTSPAFTTPDLGTPSAATLTNATGLPISGLVSSTSTALGVGSLELGNASDTTLSRSAAGTLAVEGVDVLTTSNTKTVTNKTLTSPTIATPTITSQWNFGAHTAYFTETDNGNSSTADTIDWGVSNKQKSTLTDNCTFTFTAPSGPCSLVLKLVQDGTGSRTVTWPSAVHWPSGVAPTLTTTANKVDIITFYYDGTTYFGNSSLNYAA